MQKTFFKFLDIPRELYPLSRKFRKVISIRLPNQLDIVVPFALVISGNNF